MNPARLSRNQNQTTTDFRMDTDCRTEEQEATEQTKTGTSAGGGFIAALAGSETASRPRTFPLHCHLTPTALGWLKIRKNLTQLRLAGECLSIRMITG